MLEKEDWKETVLHIEGMHCAMCATRMCNAFVDHQDIKDAKVNLNRKEAVVTYDAGKLTEDDLKQIVKDAGYEPV